MTTRRLLLGAALAAPSFTPAAAQAPAWPQRPVRLVVAFAPGGFVDVVARLLAEQLGDIWGQPVVVENRAGAGGNVAAQAMARATPDGYSALITTTAFAINLSLSRNPGYGAGQFQAAGVVAGTSTVFAVRAESPVRTLRDLVETAQRQRVTYATPGVGTPPHLSAELLFRRVGGVEATHVPFPGTGPGMTALMGGNVDVLLGGVASTVGQIRGGRVRGIAVTSARRSRVLPDVPTVAESGFEPIVDTTWVGMLFPAGTPSAVLERANAAMRQAMERPAFQERLAATGLEAIGGDLPTTQAFLAHEIATWRDTVRTVGVQTD